MAVFSGYRQQDREGGERAAPTQEAAGVAAAPHFPVAPGPFSHYRSEITSRGCPLGFGRGEHKVGNYLKCMVQKTGWFWESLSYSNLPQ